MKSNKLVSLVLSMAIVFSAAGCTNKDKKNTNLTTESSTTQKYENEATKSLQLRIIEFIDAIENSDLNLNLTNFYENVKTLKIVVGNVGASKFSSYDITTNTIMLGEDVEALGFEHEVTHVIMADRKNDINGLVDKNGVGTGLTEGLAEIIQTEVLGKEVNAYAFNSGITKVLALILGKTTLVEAINKHNNMLVVDAIASIKPAQNDAYEYLKYWDYAHRLLNKMHDEYFTTGSIGNFKASDDYVTLKNCRSDLIKRLKIYVKEYYQARLATTNYNPLEELTNMIAILSIIDNELFSEDIEIVKANDFFLKEEVQYLVSRYNISNSEYDNCVQKANCIKFFYNTSEVQIIPKN